MSLTQEYLLQLAQQCAFLLLGKINIVVHISDAPLLWRNSNAILFHTGFRLCGTREYFALALESLGVKEEYMENILSTSLTRDNYYKEYKEVYQIEVDSYNNFLQSFLPPIVEKQQPPNLAPLGIVKDWNTEPPTTPKAKELPRQRVSEVFQDITGDLDAFNFLLYQEEYQLFAKYFFGPELWIRLFNWIVYKYVRLEDAEEREELQTELATKEDVKAWLENMTDVFEGEQLIYSWYKHFKPTLLYNVHNLYTKWQFHLGEFMNRLYTRYVDANHNKQELWF